MIALAVFKNASVALKKCPYNPCLITNFVEEAQETMDEVVLAIFTALLATGRCCVAHCVALCPDASENASSMLLAAPTKAMAVDVADSASKAAPPVTIIPTTDVATTTS